VNAEIAKDKWKELTWEGRKIAQVAPFEAFRIGRGIGLEIEEEEELVTARKKKKKKTTRKTFNVFRMCMYVDLKHRLATLW
jgi:hypothetical protein